MRSFPLIVIAGLLLWLTPAPALAQGLHCKPCWYSFGKVAIGESSSYSFEITNTGKQTVRILSKSESGSGFAFGKFQVPVNIAPGQTLAVPAIFSPITRGYNHGTLTLNFNAPNSPLNFYMTGTGVANANPQLGLSPSSLNFGNVTVGSSASLQATLTASNAAVTISSDQSTSSEYVIQGLTLPITLQAGQSVTVTIQFTPNASGTANAKAGFYSNAENSPDVETLTGTGVAQTSHSVSLSWEPGDGSAVGYNVYRGTSSGGPFTEINTSLDSSTNYTDYNVVSGTTYYYVATEVNSQGQESGYSNVAQAIVPSP
jgi:hypothetical protein